MSVHPGARYLTRSEVSAMFRVNPKTLAAWVRAGKLSGIKTPGGQWRFREAEVLALLEPEEIR